MTTPPTPPRPEPVATADLVAGALLRAEADHLDDADTEISTAALLVLLAKALEDTAAERDRAHLALRKIVEHPRFFGADAVAIARDGLG